MDAPGAPSDPPPRPKRLGTLLPGQTVVEADEDLVRRLLRAQCPQWADLPLVCVGGWDNTNYRLGDDLLVRLPWGDWAPPQREIEHRWVPYLAPHLPLAVPRPLFLGEPGEGYPWPWSVFEWLPGEAYTRAALRDEVEAARTMVGFVRALQAAPRPEDPPPLGPLDRGLHVRTRDFPQVRRALDRLGDLGLVDAAALHAVWDAALAAPEWEGPPLWIHSDLHPGNVLVRDGAISAVIDWGPAMGDPAIDTYPTWWLFEGEASRVFRDGLELDEATWARGRGWTLLYSLVRRRDLASDDPEVRAGVDAALGRLRALVADHERFGP